MGSSVDEGGKQAGGILSLEVWKNGVFSGVALSPSGGRCLPLKGGWDWEQKAEAEVVGDGEEWIVGSRC